MYTATEQTVYEEPAYLEAEPTTSDIPFGPAMDKLLVAMWLAISLLGIAVIVVANAPVAGAVIIAIPSFVLMVLKPTFAMCMFMLVLPTGAAHKRSGLGVSRRFFVECAAQPPTASNSTQSSVGGYPACQLYLPLHAVIQLHEAGIGPSFDQSSASGSSVYCVLGNRDQQAQKPDMDTAVLRARIGWHKCGRHYDRGCHAFYDGIS
jgi:hypothetical protein